jgi:hypothetical protein
MDRFFEVNFVFPKLGWIDSNVQIFSAQKRCDSWAVQAAPLAIFAPKVLVAAECESPSSPAVEIYAGIARPEGACLKDVVHIYYHIISHNITYILIYLNTFKLGFIQDVKSRDACDPAVVH